MTRSCSRTAARSPASTSARKWRRGRRARRHQLLGIFVAQFVERERAARGEIERGVGQLARIERGEPRARAQVALAVGEERVAAFGERRAQADGRERVLQRAPGAHVHVHVARRDERQSGGARKRLQRGEARAVAGAREEFGGDPCAAGEDVGEPAARRLVRPLRGSRGSPGPLRPYCAEPTARGSAAPAPRRRRA